MNLYLKHREAYTWERDRDWCPTQQASSFLGEGITQYKELMWGPGDGACLIPSPSIFSSFLIVMV